jgi:solute carrier family 25 uncoupling protein 8/9
MVGSSSSSGVPDTPYQFWARFISGGVAASIAEICTIPLDTAKVRMQLQNKATGIKYTNAFQCMGTIAKEEGALALWKGLAPGILRQMVFASIRIGLYEPVRNVYHGGKQGDPSLLTKIAAGLTTGCVGIMIANPTDLVKVRVQAEGRLPPGTAKRYKGTIDAFRTIARVEGFRGLWTGVVPNMFRNSIINAAELASYDQFKQGALKFGMKDSISTHLL